MFPVGRSGRAIMITIGHGDRTAVSRASSSADVAAQATGLILPMAISPSLLFSLPPLPAPGGIPAL
jgi:hypothetical protein